MTSPTDKEQIEYAIEGSRSVLLDLKRRVPEVSKIADIDAFILNELNPALAVAHSLPSEKGDSAEAERAMIAGYRAGMKDGITDYAVWNNGGQYVGVLRKPLKQVLAQVNEIPDNIILQSALRNING